MPKIKVIKFHTENIQTGYDNYENIPNYALISEQTPWHEITAEDLDVLKNFMKTKQEYAIVEEFPYREADLILKDLMREAYSQKEHEDRKRAGEAKRLATLQQNADKKAIEKKRKKLEQLKHELGE